MLTVPEAAILVGRNPETIRRWIRSGRLSAAKVGTQLVIDEVALHAAAGWSSAVGEAKGAYESTGATLRAAAAPGTMVVVQLDPSHGRRLAELAARIHLTPEAVARSLLSTALDERDPDAAVITAVLNSIPGAWERAQQGIREIEQGSGIPLEDLGA